MLRCWQIAKHFLTVLKIFTNVQLINVQLLALFDISIQGYQ
jgi:hypothetical protein